MFFEGSEKKVEITVDKALPSLRRRGHAIWRGVAQSAQAQVLSQISNEQCDAYLLSESSLFVFDHRVVMITCGRTNLVDAVYAVLELVPMDSISALIYERKNEIFPHEQPTSFIQDAKRLQQKIPGKVYCFGDEDDHHLWLFHLDRRYHPDASDMTLEILMHGVQGPARSFFGGVAASDREALCQTTGVREILPGFVVDDHFFDPEGYSLNAIRGDDYYTVHVTPQEVGSYVSFETNCDCREGLRELVDRVLAIFRPRDFNLIFFDRRSLRAMELPGYRLKRAFEQPLNCGYQVGFFHYYLPQEKIESAHEISL